ncbi:MAG: hypothetical protein R3E76_07010 [Planctomycetota bacterium]
MVELDAQYRNDGLRIITSYNQFQDIKVIEDKVTELGIKFPVALDGFFDTRFEAEILCRVWVIGVDGKVVHAHKDGWELAALTELKKVKYPMLRRSRVRSDVKAAAAAFGEGQYAKAYKLAVEISDGDYSDNAIEDADYIIERIEDMSETLAHRADVHEINKRFDQAESCWRELARCYKGLEGLRDPDAEIKRIHGLEDYELEKTARHAFVATRLKAWALFGGIIDDVPATIKAAKQAAEIFDAFAKKHADTSVADAAQELGVAYKNWAKQLEDENASTDE